MADTDSSGAQEFFDKFLQRHVHPEEEKRRKRECQLVKTLASHIMASVCKSQKSTMVQNPKQKVKLFTGDAILVGSRAQGIHVQAESKSSDYDFLVPIQFNTNLILTGCRYINLFTPKGCLPDKESFVTGVPVYLLGNKVVADYNKLIMRDLLERKKVDINLTEEDIQTINDRHQKIWKNSVYPSEIEDFYQRVKTIVKEPLFLERRDLAQEISNVRVNKVVALTPNSPAVQLSAKVNGRAVSIDLVPTIRNKVKMSMVWPQEDLSWLSDLWDQEQGTEQRKPTWNIEEIYKTGTDLVAKGSYWRLTFSLAETRLLEDIDADGGFRREALQVLKRLKTEKWGPRHGKVLTSYHLKTVLFWASHLNPETKHWATLPDALGTLLKVLEFCLEKRQLRSYFLPSINLFDWHRSEEENSLKNLRLKALRLEVVRMRRSPVQYLRLSYDLAKPQGPGPFVQPEQKW